METFKLPLGFLRLVLAQEGFPCIQGYLNLFGRDRFGRQQQANVAGRAARLPAGRLNALVNLAEVI